MANNSHVKFVAVPVIADMPEHGWQIVSKTEFDSKLKAEREIRRLHRLQECHT